MSLFNTIARAAYGDEFVDNIVSECDHEWVHYPTEYESLSGRGTVVQYPEYYVENNMGQVIDINAVLDMKRFVRKHDLQSEATEEAIEDGTRLILKYGDDFFLGFIEMYMEELVRRNK